MRLIDGKPEPSRYISPRAYEHYIRAQIALERRDLPGAAAEYRFALTFDPGAAHLHVGLAQVLFALGQLDEAQRAVKDALGEQPDHSEALVLQGQLLWRQGRRTDAAESFRASMRSAPHYGPAYLQLAALLEQDGAFDAAVQTLEQLVGEEHASQRSEGDRRLATLCLRLVRYPCAAEHLRRLLTEEVSIDVLAQLAHVYRALGQEQKAAQLLREAFGRSDGDLDVAAVLLEVLQHGGLASQVDDLLEVVENAARDNPALLEKAAQLCLAAERPQRALALAAYGLHEAPTARLRILQAESLGRLGRVGEAERALRQLLPGEVGQLAALRLAALLGRRGQHDEASHMLRQGLAQHGPNTEIVLALSRSLFAAGQTEPSLQVIRQAMQQRPADRQLRFGLAVALQRTGAWREALAVAEQLISRDPKDGAAQNFIGYSLVEQGLDLPRAERAIRRALYLEPGEGFILDSLGWLYHRRGQHAQALDLLQMAVRLAPEEAEIIGHLAESCATANQITRAIELYQRALTLSDDEQLRIQFRRRLTELKNGRVGTR